MYSLNFDIDTARRVISLLKLLKLWGEKNNHLEIDENLLNVEYDDDCYCELLATLFYDSITSCYSIDLNEENSNISSEVYSTNQDIFSSSLDFYLSYCATDRCNDCMDKNRDDCVECKEFCSFLHSYDFKKAVVKSSLFKADNILNEEVIYALGRLFAYLVGIDEASYIGSKFNKEKAELEVLFFMHIDHPEGYVDLDYTFKELVEFFKQALQAL